LKTQYATSADGAQIAYDVQGKGPALCLLHGFSGNRAIWSDYGWPQRLRDQFTVLSLDLRGCGQSDVPLDPQAYRLPAHQADVTAVLQACGIETFSLWGWSFGGTLGLHLAAAFPVEKAVIAGTYFGPIFTEDYVQQRLTQARSPLEVARWQGLISWPSIEPSELLCPALIYTGTADGNVVVQLERQRAAIEAARIRLHIFDGFRHGQLLTMHEAVVAEVVPFLSAPAQSPTPTCSFQKLSEAPSAE
jgi:pimeloyl-ACP methyl ester carboxylesterase